MFSVCNMSALVLLVVAALACAAETISIKRSLADTAALSTLSRRDFRFSPPVSDSGVEVDLNLLDIVLVASVDGKIHALNRTSGRTLWSMHGNTAATPMTDPAMLGPLVRTQHVPSTGDKQETYVIEPQSGDIYVMNSPDSPLQRLPFTMAQLVDMSPFSFSGDGPGKVFVGNKKTSLVLLELETGKVKATLGSECPWDPFEGLSVRDPDIDLDDLEDDGDKPIELSEVYIGRTDYSISIFTSPEAGDEAPPVQNLSFSVYGPNNQDHALQGMYRRTADDAYIQSFPNGDLIALQTHASHDSSMHTIQDSTLLWATKFAAPTVAVFDVVRTGGRPQPFVLLQPRPRLEHLPSADAAYVGLVEQTGSLFAMTPERFPLVVFRDSVGHYLDAPEPVTKEDDPVTVDAITKARKEREMCENGSMDVRCLIGRHPFEDSSSNRLLDGAPSVEPSPWSGRDVLVPGTNATASPTLVSRITEAAGSPMHVLVILQSALLAVLCGAVLFFFTKYKSTQTTQKQLVSDPIEASQPAEDVAADTKAALPVTADTDAANGIIDGVHVTVLNHPDAPVLTPTPPSTPNVTQTTPTPRARNVTFVAPPTLRAENGELEGEADDTDREGDAATPTTPRKKPVRRKRGKGGRGKKNQAANGNAEGEDKENIDIVDCVDADPVKTPSGNTPQSGILLPQPSSNKAIPGPSLVITENVLGFGSHGTVVFEGSLQGRAVAVKRLLQDFVTLASREVSVLQESDDHPNVIRYYYQESHANFLYIALELCPANLADVIERPDQHQDISVNFNPKRALRQIAAGLRHLHGLKIIHRDIKPQNILISGAKSHGKVGGHRMLISDFGLCKKLDLDQTSFYPTAHGHLAAGTFGWRAPEILKGEVKLDETAADEASQSSRGSVNSSGGMTTGSTRLTKAVDIFALGCLFYYTLTNGGHPFGDRFEREVNIMKDTKMLSGLERFGEEGSEAADLIKTMLDQDSTVRPDTTSILLHPYFWEPGRRLTFLQDTSDRFEIMCRDPKDPNLLTLEQSAFSIVGNDWHSRLDKTFIDNLGKFRKYDGKSVQDLLRALRNKKHHYQDLPDNVKRHLGPLPDGFLAYFTRRFPRLFLHVHSVIAKTSLHQEPMFRSYFELATE